MKESSISGNTFTFQRRLFQAPSRDLELHHVREEIEKEADHQEREVVVVSEEIGKALAVEDSIRTRLVPMLGLPQNTEERVHQEREVAEVSEVEDVVVMKVVVDLKEVAVAMKAAVDLKEVVVVTVVTVLREKEADLEVAEVVASEVEDVVALMLQLVLQLPLLLQLHLQLPLNPKLSVQQYCINCSFVIYIYRREMLTYGGSCSNAQIIASI